ncbi:hypothetical protein [Pseudomonas paracarnis]|uniref:Ead/Ea22-like family protein n=1 Tax=Pseudomonas paracarnis TaxID=2750625 RepID=A0ABU6BTT2_9PSED|nr:hypothetical protein [Pseudomonas paracarnis]MBW9244115.1 hypothetical protein [Pseudomonas paracarnis]MEB3783723.1 hypothetical protein [Pseudomonas paracarnis]
MTDYTELKLAAEAASQSRWNQDGFDVQNDDINDYRVARCNRLADAKFIAVANPAAFLALIAENDRLSQTVESLIQMERATGNRAIEYAGKCDDLKAEVAGLRTGYEAYERVNAELKAECEALRDDLEQKQYDANAWRNSEESVWVEVFNSEGDDPFISAITGQITVEQLALIQAEILEYREDYFEKGSGLYVFRCAHYQAHHDNVGMTEPAHWETDLESYSPFPWEEEDASLGQGEQS